MGLLTGGTRSLDYSSYVLVMWDLHVWNLSRGFRNFQGGARRGFVKNACNLIIRSARHTSLLINGVPPETT